jgi:hypothetical protein
LFEPASHLLRVTAPYAVSKREENVEPGRVSPGVEVVDELQDQYWGDRYFAVRDVNGFILAFSKNLPAS